MKIEEGKFYRTRNGQKVGPMRQRGDVWSNGRHMWKREGEFWAYTESESTALTLVAEWTDDPPAPPAPDYNDGKWHGWNGGECPVDLRSIVATVWGYADGDIRAGDSVTAAREVMWTGNEQGALIAFRVVTPYREPAVAWRDSGGTFWPTREQAAKKCNPGDEPVRFVEARE